jgi:DNA polymerase III subunit beta
MPFSVRAFVGDLVPAVAFAASATPNKCRIPILANLLLTAKGCALSVTATDLDQQATSHAAAQITEPGATTVDAAKFGAWLRHHDKRVEVALVTTKNGLFAKIGEQSALYLLTLPVEDFPEGFDVGATADFRLAEAEHRRLFRETAAVIPASGVRFQLCGLHLRCADRQLIAAATDGTRIVEAQIDAPADLEIFSIIVPRDLVLAVAKMEGRVIVRVGERHVEVENGNHLITSRLIDAVFPGYSDAIPPASDNTVEVDRCALVDAMELLRAAIGQPAQTNKAELPFASISWSEGADEVLVAAGDPEIGETVIHAIARGNAHVSVPIGQFLPLLTGIDAERIALDSAEPMFPIRITKAGTDGFVAIQSQVRP